MARGTRTIYPREQNNGSAFKCSRISLEENSREYKDGDKSSNNVYREILLEKYSLSGRI